MPETQDPSAPNAGRDFFRRTVSASISTDNPSEFSTLINWATPELGERREEVMLDAIIEGVFMVRALLEIQSAETGQTRKQLWGEAVEYLDQRLADEE